MPGLVGAEVLVLGLHPLQRRLDAGIAAGRAAAEVATLLDPLAPAFGDAVRRLWLGRPRGPAQPLDGADPADLLRIEARIAQGDGPAEGMGDEGDGLAVQLVDQLGQVVDEVGHHVGPVRRPGAVPVPAQVRGDDVPVPTQLPRHPVPASGMVPPAVLQDQHRRIRIAPVEIVQPKTLGHEAVRGRSGGVGVSVGHAAKGLVRGGGAEGLDPRPRPLSTSASR